MSDSDQATGGTEAVDLDALAAYLDGGLSDLERRRMEALLARSEAAREVLAEAVRLREDLDGGADAPALGGDGDGAGGPAPGDGARGTPRRLARWLWLPLAAAAVVALLVPVVGGGPDSPALTLSDALAGGAVTARPDWHRQGWSAVRGSAPAPLERAAFRTGVRWADLVVAWDAGETALVEGLAGEIGTLLAPVPLSAPAAAAVAGLARMAAAGTALAAVREDVERAESLLAATLDEDRFRLGAWVEAARLAVLAGDGAFLAGRTLRGALGDLADAGWDPEVAAELERLGGDPASPAEVEAAAEALIRRLGG